jgi:dTDP-4-amino-4,6-dideoxygalactose transaminase
MINYAKHFIDMHDIRAVNKVLTSNNITQGEITKEFENELSNYTGYKFCKTLNSGTSALHAACVAIKIKPGDEVIIPSISFVATANCVSYCGGIPVFADIDPDTLLIDHESIKNLITNKTKAIISMDYAGQLADYKAIKEICDNNQLHFISDSCHSFGGINRLADNAIPDIVCYSFHPAKHITAGEGGALLTNDYILDHKTKLFRNHGRNEEGMMEFLGYNYRMSEINAALVLSQFKTKHFKFQLFRYMLADKYIDKLKCKKLKQLKGRIHVYHLFVIKVKNRKNRKKFINYMKKKKIQCVVHFPPIYENLFYYDLGKIDYSKQCPNTEKVADQIVSIPLYYNLLFEQQEYIINTINEFIEKE